MSWIKKGLIIKPAGNLDWMVSHAMVPLAARIGEDLYRVYFCGRDRQNRSLIGYAELDIREPERILYISEQPVLGLGALGCFDDNGVTPSWLVDHGGRKYLYYIGWNRRSTVRMSLMPGLAVSNDGGKTFERLSRAPVLERTDMEPYSILTAPCVLIENETWRMWYVSGVEWVDRDLPRYNIKYAESRDGINWDRRGVVCMDFKSHNENALARPCVIKEHGIYKMWYSYKGEDYRIGYAESKDGIIWERKDDEAGIDVSESGWDSEMIEYAFVFNHKEKKYMLYNGNNYGEEGIGYAIME
jgi:predicted GH43/DUF377 family glycosyl hydrolase